MLNGVKWHVTSANLSEYCFFQAKLSGGDNEGRHGMFIVPMDTQGLRVVRTPLYS